jgi:hypothetical protein
MYWHRLLCIFYHFIWADPASGAEGTYEGNGVLFSIYVAT